MENSPVVKIEKDIAWFRTHVLLAMGALALVAVLVFGGVSGVENLVERHDARTAAAAQAKAGADGATQAALLAQLQQAQAANVARDAEQTTLIKSLIAQMAQQHADTAKQISTDATLSAKDAAGRLIEQVKADPTEVTATANTVILDLPVTRTVVAQLDTLKQVQADVTNLQGQLGAQTTLTADAKTEAAAAQGVITADKVELISAVKADAAACKLEVDAQAAKDRKRGIWGVIAGAIFGIVVGGKL